MCAKKWDTWQKTVLKTQKECILCPLEKFTLRYWISGGECFKCGGKDHFAKDCKKITEQEQTENYKNVDEDDPNFGKHTPQPQSVKKQKIVYLK